MKQKQPLVLIFLVVLALLFGGLTFAIKTGRITLGPTKEPTISSGVSTEVTPTPEDSSRCTLYTNEEYGFSLCYQINWDLPEEEKITPSQQHLYQITLNPDGMSYMVNIYDQPSPISLGSFVRNYFQDIESGVSWTNDIEINDQEALQFFIPKAGTTPMGIGAVAFRKGSYILTISTPAQKAPEGDLKQLVNEETLTQLAESFNWVK
ncbi:hypothetical protein KKI19_02385 [Patescibacteria group bacterium]|nr:hypothetical protein [Patescibacteria group bacterium]